MRCCIEGPYVSMKSIKNGVGATNVQDAGLSIGTQSKASTGNQDEEETGEERSSLVCGEDLTKWQPGGKDS